MNRNSRLTERDRELFGLLVRTRWLSTTQIRDRFFAGRSANAVNKRMRKLVRAGWLRVVRPGMAEEQWYRLARPALRLLDDDKVALTRRLPANLDHFARINDVRLWFERQRLEHGLPLRVFLAEWEVRQPDQAWDIVPDAVVLLEGGESCLRVAVEVDRSTENPGILVSKLRRYGMLVDGCGEPVFQAVLLLVPGWCRLRTVVKALYDRTAPTGLRCILADLDRLPTVSVHAKAFLDMDAVAEGGDSLLHSLVDLLRVSCRPVLATGESADRKVLTERHLASAERPGNI